MPDDVFIVVESEPDETPIEELMIHLPGPGLLLMDEEIAWRQLTGYLERSECPYACNWAVGERCPACV